MLHYISIFTYRRYTMNKINNNNIKSDSISRRLELLKKQPKDKIKNNNIKKIKVLEADWINITNTWYNI